MLSRIAIFSVWLSSLLLGAATLYSLYHHAQGIMLICRVMAVTWS